MNKKHPKKTQSNPEWEENQELRKKNLIIIFTPGNVITSTTIIGCRWPWRVIVWVSVES